MKLGDAVSAVATPIARALNLGCIDPETNDLRPESPCAKRKALLNNLSDKMFDTFFAKETMKQEYIINKQIAIADAESPEDAVAKMVAGGGKTISFNVTVRQQPATLSKPMQRVAGPGIQPAVPTPPAK